MKPFVLYYLFIYISQLDYFLSRLTEDNTIYRLQIIWCYVAGFENYLSTLLNIFSTVDRCTYSTILCWFIFIYLFI